MTASRASAPALTDVQRRIVEEPAERKALVTAGAGTGKTFTLVRRIEYLVSEGLTGGDLIVLTFSRAASVELRERLRSLSGRSRHVRVTTFDAWALGLLREAANDETWYARSFDERIRAATRVIEDEMRAPESLDAVRHVVIDEVQDLVGDRRQLVDTFLDAYECGFTIVGDPAQAIYGFQVQDPEKRACDTGRFFSRLRERFSDELEEFALDENFRAASDDAACARPYEAAVRACSTRAEADAVHEQLRMELASKLEFGDLRVRHVRASLCDTKLTTAILCATNGDALLLSRWLADLGIDHRVRGGTDDHSVPSWVAQVVSRLPGALSISRDRFIEAWQSLPHTPDLDHGRNAWQLLLRTAGDRSGHVVKLGRLHEAIARGHLPDSLVAQQEDGLIVSTFHRAKGLEFDQVLVVDPGSLDDEQVAADRCDAARALYVAMTRARHDLYRLQPPDAYATRHRGFRLVRKVKGTQRWGRYGYKPSQRLGLSFLGEDVHGDHPAGLEQITCDPGKVQEYLAHKVRPGDEAVWTRLNDVPVAHEKRMAPGYAIMHGEQIVGVASDVFRRDLYRFVQQWKSHQPASWPRHVTGTRVDLVETVAGEDAAAVRAGLGPCGLWLAPRLIGIGRFHYDRKGEDA
ncbi:UvrD-helicase domain-containing protein [Streptomyces botrytidirepellens]|uniref:DNA helicase n=1 Tax=Streptomyces botrytidirepellens TaxID=2486417 RepID=A0A3M8WWV7_9ACTN|nr:UvrD-helicase domain-containing protein [Streptomyces botrytidirepellens]RNG33579.1 DNA helicase [Streptomyces botrytidirepellens]